MDGEGGGSQSDPLDRDRGDHLHDRGGLHDHLDIFCLLKHSIIKICLVSDL